MNNENSTLLILGTRTDPHVERVARYIEAHSETQIFVLDYHDDTRFSMEMDQSGKSFLCINGSALPTTYLVWDRSKIIPGSVLYIRGDETSSNYAAQEWNALYKLLSGLNADNVVNSRAAKICLLKPYQQMIAACVGFLVPPTLISNDKESVLSFQRRCNGDRSIVMKSLSAGKVKPSGEGKCTPYNVMTMRVNQQDIEITSTEEIAYCPHFFQKEIEKSYELRVVVVGDCILPFRIDSQAHTISEVDWRKGIDVVAFSPYSLADETVTKIHAFMKRMGLFSGSLDLIVDKKKGVWFLECNQDGAWGWLDDIVDGAITKAFAEAFINRLNILSASADKIHFSLQEC